jgi:hypothetical protein
MTEPFFLAPSVALFAVDPSAEAGCLFVGTEAGPVESMTKIWTDAAWVFHDFLPARYRSTLDTVLVEQGFIRTDRWREGDGAYIASILPLAFIGEAPSAGQEFVDEVHEAALQGLGLVAVLRDTMAREKVDWHVPGLDEAAQTLQTLATVILHPIGNLQSCGPRTPKEDIQDLLRQGEGMAAEAQAAQRQVAQLALGVSAAFGFSLEVERIDRMASIMLTARAPELATLFFDGTTSRAEDADGLFIELAGLFSRLSLEHGAGIVIAAPDTTMSIVSDAEGNLVASITTSHDATQWGWRDDQPMIFFEPVTIAEPTNLVLRTLKDVTAGDWATVSYLPLLQELPA